MLMEYVIIIAISLLFKGGCVCVCVEFNMFNLPKRKL